MSNNKTRDLTAVFFVGLFLLTKQLVFIWFLIGAMILLRSGGKKSPKADRNSLRRIQKDARSYDLALPKQPHLKALLVQVYERLDQALLSYPHLQQEYEEIMTELWRSLKGQPDQSQWHQILATALSSWPDQSPQPENSLQKKINEVTRLSRQWDEAKKEVYGGANV